MNPQGTITAAFGRHYEIELDDGRLVTGYPRGKKSPHACGDRVELTLNGLDQGQIVDHLPRQSLLYRSDAWKQKMIAANATQIILVVATEPAFYDDLLSRALAAAEHENLRTLIILNKCDLAERVPAAREMLAPFTALGYPILELSARDAATAAAQLRPRLQGQVSVLVGQSGMGKSTLINALLPEAKAATREISAALDSGKHTTTHARLYRLDAESAIIDSPGLQEFGLAHLSLGEIEHAFLEMRPYLGQCRFRDCRHENEPDCAIKTAVADGRISPRRLAHFLGLLTPTRSAS